MRYMRTVLGAVTVLAAVNGCHSEETEVELAPIAHSPVVLFDASPAYPSAAGLLYRSDWPSTESSYQFGESIIYQERYLDIQYSSPWGRWNNDRTYRRFSAVRTGVGIR
jgi:hypothetical protein